MPSRKKKNKKPESLHKKLSVTKSYFDKCTTVMHKMFRLLELDPQLYDQLTKKQKQEVHAPDDPAPVSQSLLTRFFAEKAPKPISEEVLKEIEKLY